MTGRQYDAAVPATQRRAPGIPGDYYERIRRFEDGHFWYQGMRSITAALLEDRLTQPGQRLLDAGCGTGGFLRWAVDHGAFAHVAGIDIGADAIELARGRVPEAELVVGPLRMLPFADRSFDLVVTNDVLQHVPEGDVPASLAELRRVLDPTGALLVHTNGSASFRRERDDWRAYDAATLRAVLATAGFVCTRVTYANTALSLWGRLRGRVPHAPSEEADGIPTTLPSAFVSAVGRAALALEARWLVRPQATLPYGHTLFALAVPDGRP
jgi:ubiquinone/menaquinone biosynthesis C-methylase UbiE